MLPSRLSYSVDPLPDRPERDAGSVGHGLVELAIIDALLFPFCSPQDVFILQHLAHAGI